MLSYPMLDDRTGSARMPPPPVGTFVWTAEHNHFAWPAFLGAAPGGDRVPAGAVPARHPNLAGLPPAFIGVGSIDLFVGEDVEYARRLIDSGVPTELNVIPGAFHIFDAIAPQSAVARTFQAARFDALRRAFIKPT
jgi:acetyl esterase/lipase